jgi:AcrR family transcriptional regulator
VDFPVSGFESDYFNKKTIYVKMSIMAIDTEAREQQILDAAAKLIVQYGYNKTTMSDVAEAVGLNRALIYAHFRSKDDLLRALIAREMIRYRELWLAHIEANPNGGTVASIYRAIGYALKNTPLMAAIVTRHEGIFGNYLRKPGNLFEGLQTPTLTYDLLQAMQAAGAVRQGANIATMAYILDAISQALVALPDAPDSNTRPPFDELMATIAEICDCLLSPADGSGSNPGIAVAAGKDILRQFAATSRAHFEQMQPSIEGKATHENPHYDVRNPR